MVSIVVEREQRIQSIFNETWLIEGRLKHLAQFFLDISGEWNDAIYSYSN